MKPHLTLKKEKLTVSLISFEILITFKKIYYPLVCKRLFRLNSKHQNFECFSIQHDIQVLSTIAANIVH